MTQEEFDKLHSLRSHQKPSKATEAARRVLVLGEQKNAVAIDLGLNRGNVTEAVQRYLRLRDKWAQSR